VCLLAEVEVSDEGVLREVHEDEAREHERSRRRPAPHHRLGEESGDRDGDEEARRE